MNSPKILLTTLAIGALLCGCQKQETAPAAGSAAPAIVSAEKTSFDEVTAKLNKGGNLYLYLSTEQALSHLSEKISSISNALGGMPITDSGQKETINNIFGAVKGWLEDSGIQNISGVGMSSIAREPGYYYGKMVVHHYPGKGDGMLWSLFGKSPKPLKELDLLPATTVFAAFSDVDVPLLWDDVQKHVNQMNVPQATQALQQFPGIFHEKTGLELKQALASLGGNYGIILTLDQEKKITWPMGGGTMEVPTPGLAIVVKANSDAIFDRVDELLKGNQMVSRIDNPTLKMRTMAIPLPLPVELRPSIARSGDYLFLASSDALIQEMLDVQAGKKKGFKSTPEFARLSQGIPGDGNNFSIVSDQFVKTVMQIQQQSLTNKGNMTAAQVDALQHAFNTATNYGNYAVGVNGDDGWEGFSNGTQSGMQIIAIPLAFGVGLGAAIAIPAYIKAHKTAEQHASVTPRNDAQALVPTANLRRTAPVPVKHT